MEQQLSKEYYLIKAEGVKDCVKWLEKRIKMKQKFLKETSWSYMFEYKLEEEEDIRELITVKISFEKYAKKLKHMLDENKI